MFVASPSLCRRLSRSLPVLSFLSRIGGDIFLYGFLAECAFGQVIVLNAGYCVVDTPFGPFGILTRGTEFSSPVLASGWVSSPADLRPLIAEGIRPAVADIEPVEMNKAGRAVQAYFSGDASLLGKVEVLTHGTEFRKLGWGAMKQIKAGQTMSYADFAAMMGNPDAVRAAASVCSSNPAVLFVPCHRVVTSSGDVGNYRYGSEIKADLLDMERGLVQDAKE